MKEFRMLYKIMYDDLKDAEMIAHYACKVKEEDKALAQELQRYGQSRMQHFKEMHRLFVERAMNKTEVNSETVSNCLWDVTHEHMQEWYSEIEKKLKF